MARAKANLNWLKPVAWKPCPRCRGKGVENAIPPECSTCKGTGRKPTLYTLRS